MKTTNKRKRSLRRFPHVGSIITLQLSKWRETMKALFATILAMFVLGCTPSEPTQYEKLAKAKSNLEHAQMVYLLFEQDVAKCYPQCAGSLIGARSDAEFDVKKYAAQLAKLEEKE